MRTALVLVIAGAVVALAMLYVLVGGGMFALAAGLFMLVALFLIGYHWGKFHE